MSTERIYQQMKKLMILGGSELQFPAFKKANGLGIQTICIDYDRSAPARKIADSFYCISTIDKERVYEIAKKENIDGIITLASDLPVRTVAYVNQKLGKRTQISPENANKATDKSLMRECLRENNVPIPHFEIVNNYNDFSNYCLSKKFPLIIKPALNSGSRGVFLLKSEKDIDNAFSHAMNNSPTGVILIEEYISGREVSVEIFSQNGKARVLAITDKETTGCPFFVETGHKIPTNLDKDISCKIKEVAIKANQAINQTNGPAHVEIRLNELNEPKVIEIGARMGGDHITTDLVPLATGHDMIKYTILNALEEKFDYSEEINAAAAISFFSSQLSPNQINELRQNIYDLSYQKKDQIKEWKSSNDRSGHILLTANTRTELDKKLDYIIDKYNLK